MKKKSRRKTKDPADQPCADELARRLDDPDRVGPELPPGDPQLAVRGMWGWPEGWGPPSDNKYDHELIRDKAREVRSRTPGSGKKKRLAVLRAELPKEQLPGGQRLRQIIGDLLD